MKNIIQKENHKTLNMNDLFASSTSKHEHRSFWQDLKKRKYYTKNKWKAIHQINLKKSVAMFSSCYKITASANKSEKSYRYILKSILYYWAWSWISRMICLMIIDNDIWYWWISSNICVFHSKYLFFMFIFNEHKDVQT
jgi:hypothetical protein